MSLYVPAALIFFIDFSFKTKYFLHKLQTCKGIYYSDAHKGGVIFPFICVILTFFFIIMHRLLELHCLQCFLSMTRTFLTVVPEGMGTRGLAVIF